ncbi:MAG TPA: PAS domain S-box protein, partial [Prolixibacteraceae bacterium]
MKNKFRKPALLHILSLEDSVLDFEIIKEQLIKAGYTIKISRVETKDEFINLIRSQTYELILADYNLPQFDAFEALKLCQEYCPDTPFICISGAIGETRLIELLKNGATDYVMKDQLERLPLAIKRALKEAKELKDKKQAEQSLLISEEKYRTIFENVQDVFYQTDLKGIILEISPSIKNFSNLTRNEIIDRSVYELYFNPDEREIFLKQIKEKGEIRDYEIKFKTDQGETRMISINARLIFNSEGQPDHIDGALRDITNQKLAEETIMQSEAELNYAQQIAKMGSWNYNLVTNKTKWSKNMYNILGHQSIDQEITYNDYLSYIHPDDRYLVDLNLEEMLKTKAGVSFDFRYILP